MSDRTFFFRDGYNLKEMFERIYAPDFIEAFRQHGNIVDEEGATLEINKNNCYVGLSQSCNNEEDQIYREMEEAFEMFGRLGDKLNVKLYKLSGFDFTLTDAISNRIDGYKNRNQNMKEVDTFSPTGLKYNLFIEDTRYKQGFMDVKFKIEMKSYIYEPIPEVSINTFFIEVRLYHSTGLVAVFNPNGTAKNSTDVLYVLFLLFHPQTPIINEVVFDEAQLIMIQLKLNGEVSSPRLKTDNDLKVDIYGLNKMNYEDPLVKAVNSHAKLRIYELQSTCVVQGHRFNLKISEDGRIQIETFVETDVLDRIIVDIEWTILKSHYFKPTSMQIDELMKIKNKGSLQTQRRKKEKEIQQDLVLLLNNNKSNSSLGEKAINLTTTILLNIGHFLSQKVEEIVVDGLVELDLSTYLALREYLIDYLVIKFRHSRTRSTEYANKIIRIMQKMINLSSGDAVNLIEQFENMIRTD
ncbi:hypothetical protein M2444_003536 [Paenibacillus sp. PastF-3]|uniref:hypothetical protein n=1 Tax=Paenibacillus sp. PastF-3 TaxID=2940626 RepID=UPI0024754536|nr:hypothetical protein [Paenibacillus sp. PastF-3]MDH6371737.1 hypothetical protein [Paenibacillus sp. PastF-3]